MQVNQVEIDNYLLDNAARLSGLTDKKKLVETALLFFMRQHPLEQIETPSTNNQADKLMSFAGKVKFDRDGLEYQNSIRNEWE